MTHIAATSLGEGALRQLLQRLGVQALEHRFAVAPNPCVGSAILAGSRVIGLGFHEVWGGPHAEPQALAAARASGVPEAEWDTWVVTLEPCSSHGKTPPCVDKMLEVAATSGLRRVVVGASDPDARHRGAGLTRLREAGLEVLELDGEAPLEKVSPHFLAWNLPERLRRPRPWTIAKWAQTRSGQLTPPLADEGGRTPEAPAGGWISSEDSRAEVHVLRGRVDAIATGVSTVLLDDPRLTVRPPGDPAMPPKRVVLDSYLRTPTDARLFQEPGGGEGAGEIHVLCQGGAPAARTRALAAAGASVTALPASEEDHVRLREVQTWLWSRGVRRLLVEAGPTLLGRYLELGFVDQLLVYTGNVNGGQGTSMADWFGRLRLDGRLDRECGPDSVIEAFVLPN